MSIQTDDFGALPERVVSAAPVSRNEEAMERALDRLETEEQFADMGVVLAVKNGSKSFSAGAVLSLRRLKHFSTGSYM